VKTEELVKMLAVGVEAVDPRHAARRSRLAIATGTLIAVAFTAGILRFNPALPRYLSEPMFWTREAYCAALSAIALLGVHRIARPGRRLGLVPAALGLVVLAMWLLAALALEPASPPMRIRLVLGATAAVCPVLIGLVAAPLLVAQLWILRGLAPTRPALAGAVAGFAAGSLGALIYTLHCPELAAPFIGIWYLCGILIPAAVGAALGPRLLRW
jgi:hypothetical protein